MAEREDRAQGGKVSKEYELKPGAPNYTPQTRDDPPGSTGVHELAEPATAPTPQDKAREWQTG